MNSISTETISTDTSGIRQWRSIVTLIVFIGTNIIVLFPFHVPVYIPRPVWNAFLDTLSALRIISPREKRPRNNGKIDGDGIKTSRFSRLDFPLNFITAPLIADLFLLAILAIGRTEVKAGTLGADHIEPYSIMIFFLSLAYIAISIDASGVIRYLAFKVLQKAGNVGHRLFFYLYAFFFALGTFIGNDPIILSGTAFLAYMTRVSSNIIHPRAWIHSQFAVANIASAILVSSNPTNLVLAGAFNVKFIYYTANMIVPVVITAIVLFPFLLYIVFADEALIPLSIKMHELTEEEKAKKPVNPNIPNARGIAQEEENRNAERAENAENAQRNLLSLEEIMNPFLDKGGATFGGVIMAAALITLIALNAVDQKDGEHPVYWVTLPAAVVMFCWDLGFGWVNRKETRDISRRGREEIAEARRKEEESRRAARESEEQTQSQSSEIQPRSQDSAGTKTRQQNLEPVLPTTPTVHVSDNTDSLSVPLTHPLEASASLLVPVVHQSQNGGAISATNTLDEKQDLDRPDSTYRPPQELSGAASSGEDEEKRVFSERNSQNDVQQVQPRFTLASFIADRYRWSQETFPTVTAVLTHLPYALVPFAFCMFVLVQALQSKGWVQVLAHGWDHWVNKTGTVGAIGGMGFVSVILCNFAGTNIGTTILLCRVIQVWQKIHENNQIPITDRTFWGTVYAMALGVNYGAFSTAFSASLAGLLWRDILSRKHIKVRRLDFARENLPIIAIAMAVGCAVLTIEIYVVRNNAPYDA